MSQVSERVSRLHAGITPEGTVADARLVEWKVLPA
jgi:hypothetical protein